MDVSHTLTVDGYIQANSRDVRNTQNSLASGGSGGSIIIRAVNITGRVTLLTSQGLLLWLCTNHIVHITGRVTLLMSQVGVLLLLYINHTFDITGRIILVLKSQVESASVILHKSHC